MGDGRQAPAAIVSLMKEREPIKEKTQQKYKQGPFEDLPQHGSIAHSGKLFPGKAHGIANGKKKGRKYQVGRGTPIPVGMAQWREREGLAARGIYDYHKTNGHSSENIQGQAPGRGRKHWCGQGLSHAATRIKYSMKIGNIFGDLAF